MTIVIRVDASIEIGSGHVMRCLTMAKNLRSHGQNVVFWMEALEGNLIDFVNKEGFKNISTFQKADLYIIDHYQLGIEWEQKARQYTKKIMVIDDLAREHDCDLVLDQNALPHFENRYDNKVPALCVRLLGPKFLIVRDEFIEARHHLRHQKGQVERLLVFMGGSDPTNETMKILRALEDIQFSYIDVVVGNSNPLKNEIKQLCQKRGYYFHCQINYMARLMQEADFSLGAGGSTLWERCYVGLPSSSTIVADNQRETTNYADSIGVTYNLGWHEQVTDESYKELLCNLQISDMGNKGLLLTKSEEPNPWLLEILELIK